MLMPDSTTWIRAVRRSHERMTALVTPLTDEQAQAPSYASEWSIAEVASHLGSQAEIFGLFLTAGLDNEPPPGGEVFAPIWDRWNMLPPLEQITSSVAANEAFVTRLEHIPPAAQQTFTLSMFGSDLDLAGLAALRLGEHAVHTWDIAVALDPAATISADAVELLIDRLGQPAARSGKPIAGGDPIGIETTEPERRFLIVLDPDVTLTDSANRTDGSPTVPAEAFVRLVYGRLDPDHTPAALAED
ncbi:MAG TPA: maleylpyruvate isomerase family mycothiol-dependent enzyme, partial [Jatrophihabitans sp.]